MARAIAMVDQNDIHIANLTVRETLCFALKCQARAAPQPALCHHLRTPLHAATHITRQACSWSPARWQGCHVLFYLLR